MNALKFGIIYVGYNDIKYTPLSIIPWISIRYCYPKMFKIAAVSIPFMEYKDENIKPDGTTQLLKEIYNQKHIHYFFDNPLYIKESAARTLPLENFIKDNIDYIFLVDSDEIYTLNDISGIINLVNDTRYDIYKINFKNYIYDGKSYLDKYCTPRIYNIKCNSGVKQFYGDCDLLYKNGTTDKQMQQYIIPKEIAHIKHMTWLNERGKEKVAYQKKHFGACSYKWDDINNTLILDMDYYDRMGYERPNIIKE